jgi:hypothetical protein
MLDDKDCFHTSSAGAEYIATEGESIPYATLKIRSSSAASRKSKFGILSLARLALAAWVIPVAPALQLESPGSRAKDAISCRPTGLFNEALLRSAPKPRPQPQPHVSRKY